MGDDAQKLGKIEMENNQIISARLINDLEDYFIRSNKYDIYKVTMESVERPLIEKVLERTFGNQLKAAKLLGINRNTLRAKIKKLGINPNRWKI